MASVKKIQGKKGISYKITVTIGRTADGKQKRHYMTYRPPEGAKERDIKRELQKIVAEYENALFTESYQPDSKITFSEYAEYVYKLKERSGAKPSTMMGFKYRLEKVFPIIGNMQIVDIRPKHINTVIDILKSGQSYIKYAYPNNILLQKLEGENITELEEKSGVDRNIFYKIKHGKRLQIKTAKKIEIL